jgi:exopolysaccharide/PEP-CTERM locus tyrosine autokinase
MSVIEKALGKARANADAATPASIPVVDTGATTARQRALQMPPSRIAQNPDIRITDPMLEKLGLLAEPGQDFQRVSEFRHVKRSLLGAIRSGQSNRVILVASALAGEGKSFSSANLARSLALEPDYTVLLIDADVAKPHVSSSLGLLERKGLMDAITEADRDVESLILSTDIEGLSVLPAGTSNENATEHLSSDRMRAVLDLLQEVPNRIIVIDSLPILLTTEARVLAPLAGQVLMVVRAESTSQSAVKHALEVLGEGVNVKLLLNAIVQTRASRYLGYDYGYKYGYGDASGGKRRAQS